MQCLEGHSGKFKPYAPFNRKPVELFEECIRFLDPDLDFVIGHAISAIRGRFLLIFALDKLNVHHISTSALVDLLT